MKVFVTGADGFIGRNLCQRLQLHGLSVTMGARVAPPTTDPPWVSTGDLAANHALASLLAGHDVVVHLAGRAHEQREPRDEAERKFRIANIEGTRNLCRASIDAGVQRFVFISSIGVLGNRSTRPLTEQDVPEPVEPYARSKLAAELALQSLAADSGIELVVIRPTLVYGPHCPGTMARLIRLVRSGIPLPFAGLEGRRSLIGIHNLEALIECAIRNPVARGQVFLAADGEDISLCDLIRHLAAGLGISPKLFSFPRPLLSAAAHLIGQGESFEKLTASLQVDSSKARRVLGWKPEVTVDEGLRETARSFATEPA